MTEEIDIDPYSVKWDVFNKTMRRYQMRWSDVDRDFDDLFQEAVIKIWKNGKVFNSRKGLICYLADAVRTSKIDAYRKDRVFAIASPSLKKKDNSYSIEILDFIRETNPDRISPDRIFLNAEREKFLKKTIDGLPDNQRQVIILVYYKDKTYKEAAEIMGYSIRQIRDYLWYAIDNLKTKSALIAANCNIISKEEKPLPNRITLARKDKRLGEQDNFEKDY